MRFDWPTGTRWSTTARAASSARSRPTRRRSFEVKFDVASGDDYYNKMVGNTVLVDDLYALNGGGPK